MSRLVFATILGVLLLAGCGSPGSEIPPPPAPETLFLDAAAVADQRAAKDRQFKTMDDSPITASELPQFEGLEYYPYDPSLRFVVRFQPFDDPEPLTMTTTGGAPRPAVRAGYFEFEQGGRSHRLVAYQLRDSSAGWNELFVPFMDETTGVETYGAGRYLSFPFAPDGDGWYGLDFNLAYHPLCAYGRSDYVCPRTPEENRLGFPVRAGERGRAGHKAEGPTH